MWLRNVLVTLPHGKVTASSPRSWQNADGRCGCSCRYVQCATSLNLPLLWTQTHSRVKPQYFTHNWNCWMWNNRQIVRWTLDPLQWPILNHLEHEFDSAAYRTTEHGSPHAPSCVQPTIVYCESQQTYTRLIQYCVLYVLARVITTLLLRNVDEHVRLILKTEWTHSRTAIMGFKVGYWVKEREPARPWRSQRCIFLKMLKDTAMADGRYKYSIGGVVLKILLIIPWSRVLLEKLTDSQLVKKFPAFYGTRRFITAFTSARHLSLFWAR